MAEMVKVAKNITVNKQVFYVYTVFVEVSKKHNYFYCIFIHQISIVAEHVMGRERKVEIAKAIWF